MNTEITKQATLLIVDDNQHNIQLLKAILSLRGYHLVIAKNGIEAMESVSTVIPDLVIMDVMMPEMDGFETCRSLKDYPETQNVPIIFLTAKSHIDDIMKGFELGAVDYITKPYSTNELIARIEIHLRLKFSQETIVKQRNELKEIVQILCHDISNPLGAVMSSFEMAEYDPNYLNSNRKLITSYIKKQYEIIGMVRDLRAIAENKRTFTLQPVELNAALNDALATLRFRLNEKKITIDMNMEDNLDVLAERVSLVNSVLNNLLTNAIKFSYPDSVITIKGWKEGRRTFVIIEDRGIGIPEDLMQKIFDVDRCTNRYGTLNEKGTGFGMPLVKKFMTEYGATLDVSSRDEESDKDDHGTRIQMAFKTP